MSNIEKIRQEDLEYIANKKGVPVREICCICGKKIEIAIFKGTGVCCELHRKDRDNDHAPARIGSTP